MNLDEGGAGGDEDIALLRDDGVLEEFEHKSFQAVDVSCISEELAEEQEVLAAVGLEFARPVQVHAPHLDPSRDQPSGVRSVVGDQGESWAAGHTWMSCLESFLSLKMDPSRALASSTRPLSRNAHAS
jgi:hypothetical protein